MAGNNRANTFNKVGSDYDRGCWAVGQFWGPSQQTQTHCCGLLFIWSEWGLNVFGNLFHLRNFGKSLLLGPLFFIPVRSNMKWHAEDAAKGLNVLLLRWYFLFFSSFRGQFIAIKFDKQCCIYFLESWCKQDTCSHRYCQHRFIEEKQCTINQ